MPLKKNIIKCPYCLFGTRGIKNKYNCEYCSNEGILNDTKMYVYVSYDKNKLPGVGYFYPVSFSRIDNNKNITKLGYRKTLNTKVFCFVLNDDEYWENNWSKSVLYNFSISKIIDFEKMREWYENTKLKKHTKISPFFLSK